MITQFNGQELDTEKHYIVCTTKSDKGEDNPWYVSDLKYYPNFKSITFKSDTNCEYYSMHEKHITKIEEYHVERGMQVQIA